jgi:hypothetical protein
MVASYLGGLRFEIGNVVCKLALKVGETIDGRVQEYLSTFRSRRNDQSGE